MTIGVQELARSLGKLAFKNQTRCTSLAVDDKSGMFVQVGAEYNPHLDSVFYTVALKDNPRAYESVSLENLKVPRLRLRTEKSHFHPYKNSFVNKTLDQMIKVDQKRIQDSRARVLKLGKRS